MSVDTLMAARSVAVVGASPSNRASSFIFAWAEALAGGVQYWPVNPRYDEIEGLRSYSSLADLPGHPDVVVLAVGPNRLPELVDEAIALRPSGLTIFSDLRLVPEGNRLRADLQASGIAVIGSNCMGGLSVSRGLAMYAGDVNSRLLDRGTVGVVSQSGSATIGFISAAPRLRFTSLFSTGNEDTATAADFIGHLANDDDTRVIGCFLEAIRDPAAFRAACAAADASRKPVVALTVGESPRASQNVTTHSGALAPDAAVMSAFLADCGVIEVASMSALIETLVAFQSPRRPAGNAVGMVHVSGGQASLQLDVGSRHGLEFPTLAADSIARLEADAPWLVEPDNPIDTWGARPYTDSYPLALETLGADPLIDIVVANQDVAQYVCDAGPHVARTIAGALIESASGHDKPTFMVSNIALGFDDESMFQMVDAGVPLLVGAEAAYAALGHWTRFWGRRPGAPDPPYVPPAVDIPDGSGPLDEVRSLQMLSAHGLRAPAMIEAATVDDAVVAGDRIGYPVVVKGVGRSLLHKTEAGAVVTGIRTAEELRDAAERIAATAGATSLLVVEQVERHRELMLGAHHEPQLGLVMLVGVGGVMAEVISDVQIAVPPVSSERARAMIDGLRSASWLGPWRHLGAADRDSLVETIVAFGRAVAAMGDRIESMDVNPLAVFEEGEGCVMLDAVVVLR